MNVKELNIRKTALLFFDMLNIYYHGASEQTKKRMKPVVDNAIRLMNAARQNRILSYYAMANHRPDGESRSLVITDTDMRLNRGRMMTAILLYTARLKDPGSKKSSRKSRRSPKIT